MQNNQIFLRQRDIYDVDLDHSVAVIGCGSLGSWITMALTKLGVCNFNLWDFDNVEAHNLPNQVFTNDDIGSNKARALRDIIRCHVPDTEKNFNISIFQRAWQPSDEISSNLIINAPDSITIRKQVMENLPKRSFVIDVRSGGEDFNIFCADTSSNREMEFYREQFFEPSEATGTDCSARATVYNSMLIASLAVGLYVRWAARQPYPNMIEGSTKAFVFTPLWVNHKPEE